jgi:transposase-like protein
MAKGGPVAEDEEKSIIQALESGKTTREVAKEYDRAPSTISDIARRSGLDMAERARMKKADVARMCYASEDRIKLVGELLNKAKAMVKTCQNPKDLQHLAMVIAIGIDKRRLEDGGGNGDKPGEIKMLFDKMQEEEAKDGDVSDPGRSPA